MVNVLKLLLPALFPSWRFFDVIGPSPRVELCLLQEPEEEGEDWQPCRLRPRHLSAGERLGAFFWNARWNETLFLANCAERILQGQEEHCSREIARRLRSDLVSGQAENATRPYFRFRLVFVSRFEGRLRSDVAFVSQSYPTFDAAAA